MVVYFIICAILCLQTLPLLSDNRKDKKTSTLDAIRLTVGLLAGVSFILFWWGKYLFS